MEIIKPDSNEIIKSENGILKIKETIKSGGWAFFDIDGTLENANGIPDSIYPSLQSLFFKGVINGICTGRCPTEVIKFLGKIGDLSRELFSGWIFLEDSHVISKPGQPITEASVITSPISLQEMKAFEAVFKSQWTPAADIPGWGYLNNLPAPPLKLAPYPFLGSVSIWEKGPYESPDYAHTMSWAIKVAQSLGTSTLDLCEVGDGSFRLLQHGIDKGTGISMLAEQGIIDLNHTLYFGDANNDIPAARVILSGGGSVVALANATAEFKHIATYVTHEASGLGVIEVVNQII